MNPNTHSLHAICSGAVRENTGVALTAAVLLSSLGLLSIVVPAASGGMGSFWTGIILLAGAVVQVVLASGILIASGGHPCAPAYAADVFGRALLVFLMSVLTLMVGMVMIWQPHAVASSITLLLALYFATTGLAELAAAMNMRPAGSGGWMLLNAIVTLLLAVTIGQQLPVLATWTLGVLFGVKMMCSGVTLVFGEDGFRKAVRSAFAAGRMKKGIRF